MVYSGLCSAYCKAALSRTSFSISRTSTLKGSVSASALVPCSMTCEPALLRYVVPMRLAFFWVSNYLAEIVGAFMATGILQLRGVHGKSGWRYLFLIEGLITLIVGVASFFMMPPGPTQTKTWYRPNGWFTERYVPLLQSIALLYLLNYYGQ